MAPAKKRASTSRVPPLRIRGSAKESTELHRAHAEQRAKATTLIQPHEVKGEYDMERLLMTTLGGEIRPLTHEDLRQFRHNAKVAGSRFKGGITPQQVINLSRQEDRERANKQIHMALPAGANKGVVRFVTNAGPDSEVTRHHVEVEFRSYEAVIASPGDPKKLANMLAKKSPVAFRCDCGRWKYWFAYLATIGNYAYGIREPAFPKIRNPQLTGVACKHILRVMKEVDSNTGIRNIIATMIDKAQRSEGRLHVAITQANANEIAKKQTARRKEIAVKESKATVTPAGKALMKKVAEKKPPPVRSPVLKKAQDQKAAQLLADLKQLPAEQLAALLAQLK